MLRYSRIDPEQPTCGHRTSHHSPTGRYRGGHDIFCGSLGWTNGERKIFPPVATIKCVITEKTTGIKSKITKKKTLE